MKFSRLLWWRTAETLTSPPPAEPAPRPEPPSFPETAALSESPARQEDPAGAPPVPANTRIALDVLDVGDLVESYDIRMCLAEALAPLPEVEIVIPRQGEPFDRSRHRWETTEPTSDATAVKTIAYMISAGLADRNGVLLRPARVAVYNKKEV